MPTDADLVTAVLAGERAAYAELVSRYDRSVRAAAMAVLNDFHAVQDVAQDAFITAYEKLGSLRNPGAFGAWVLRISRQQALQAARKWPAAESLDTAAGVPVRGNGRLEEGSEILLAAVARLPEHERRVVMLHYFDGHAVSAIAEMCGRPVGTVTKQLSRARERLRRRLAKELER